MYLHTRDLRNILYHPAWSSTEAVLFRCRPLFHLWRSPETIPSKLDASFVGKTFTHTKDHRKALHSTHIRGFQVALKQAQMKMRQKHVMGFLPRQRAIYLASVRWEYNSPGLRQRSEAHSLRRSRFARELYISRSASCHARRMPRHKDHRHQGAF
jgi:hypothetical protein